MPADRLRVQCGVCAPLPMTTTSSRTPRSAIQRPSSALAAARRRRCTRCRRCCRRARRSRRTSTEACGRFGWLSTPMTSRETAWRRRGSCRRACCASVRSRSGCRDGADNRPRFFARVDEADLCRHASSVAMLPSVSAQLISGACRVGEMRGDRVGLGGVQAVAALDRRSPRARRPYAVTMIVVGSVALGSHGSATRSGTPRCPERAACSPGSAARRSLTWARMPLANPSDAVGPLVHAGLTDGARRADTRRRIRERLRRSPRPRSAAPSTPDSRRRRECRHRRAHCAKDAALGVGSRPGSRTVASTCRTSPIAPLRISSTNCAVCGWQRYMNASIRKTSARAPLPPAPSPRRG